MTRRRDDDPRALQPRDAHDLAGVGPAARRQDRHRRAARHAAGRHRVGRARRCGPWRSSTTSSPPSAGPYAGVVGYLDFSGNIDTAIAIRTLVVGDDGRASVQAGAGHRRRQRARARGPRVPQQGPGPAGRHPGRPPHDGAAARPRRRTGHPRWVAFRSWGPPSTCARPSARCRSSATSCSCQGPEAVAYLQGQLSQDVEALGVGRVGAGRSCCSPPGKVDAWLRVTRTGDDAAGCSTSTPGTARPCWPGSSASSCAPRPS